MNKILTISVAAYNFENYLENTLSSLAIDEIIDNIDPTRKRRALTH